MYVCSEKQVVCKYLNDCYTLFENESIIDINYPDLFSTFKDHRLGVQGKYVRKFEISRGISEKTQNFGYTFFFFKI